MASMALAALPFAACDDDIDEWKVSDLSQTIVELESAENIVISKSNMAKVVLQMSYTADGHDLYLTNDTSASTTLGQGVYTLHIATTQDFSGANTKTVVLDDPIKGANDITYTGKELNILAMSMGLAQGEAGKLFFRVSHGFSADDTRNVVSSQTIEILVTPLYVNMTKATILNAEKSEVLGALYSPSENEIYEGFLATLGGWTNFWVTDGLEQTWGNLGVDDSFAKVDLASNGAWNFWTAEPAGCIFICLNTNAGQRYISYTALTSLSASGDASADLVFDASSCKWVGTVETTKDDADIVISGKTLTNDNGTGANADAAKEGAMPFASNGDGTISPNIALSTPITVAKAGKYKLEISLREKPYTFTLTDMSGVKTYPSAIWANVGDEKTQLTTEVKDGMPTGLYTGSIVNATAGATLSFSDGDGNAAGGTKVLDKEAKYNITLNLADGTLTADAVEYEIAETIGLYFDADCAWLQATFFSGADDNGAFNGIYSGLFYKDNDDWNFYCKDTNGVTFGVDENYEQFSFVNGASGNFWVSECQKSYLYTFNVAESRWSETQVNSIAITGDFNSWDLNANKLTDNADGTWTISDVTLIDEQWGPYLVINGDWDLKLYLASDGKSLTTAQGQFLTNGAGTYDITVSTKNNTVSLTKK